MGGRMVKRRGLDLRVVHEALSLTALAALVVHALALLGDGYLRPSLADIAIPFASGYQRWWMALGIVAGWMLLLLGLSYYARARIGVARWRPCTASPRWPGCSASATRWAWAPTRAPPGSSSRSSRRPRPGSPSSARG